MHNFPVSHFPFSMVREIGYLHHSKGTDAIALYRSNQENKFKNNRFFFWRIKIISKGPHFSINQDKHYCI